ncbi:glycosyltransferase [Vibrio vulnificus]|nr:glycosyltransferase [Vibrio vulnificus]
MNVTLIAHISSGEDRGDASEIRTKFIKKGLEEEGFNFRVLSYHSSEKVTKSPNFKSLFFINNSSRVINYLLRLFLAPFLIFIELFKERHNIGNIMVDRLPIYVSIPVSFFSLIFGKKIILIINEFPSSLINSKRVSFKNYIDDFSIKLIGVFVRKLIVISSEHELVYKRYVSKKAEIIIIPILMSSEETYTPVSLERKQKKITYAGAISRSNGIEVLIEAAKLLYDNEIPYVMTIIGPSISKSYIDEIKFKINRLGISEKIEILPATSNDNAIRILRNSDILVIPKIKDQRAVGYIPSKLGDFLYTGRPVICTNVGDVSKYISHGENGFLVEPDSAVAIYEAIKKLLKNYEAFDKVGLEGIKVANKFDYRAQSKALKSFIIDIFHDN